MSYRIILLLLIFLLFSNVVLAAEDDESEQTEETEAPVVDDTTHNHSGKLTPDEERQLKEILREYQERERQRAKSLANYRKNRVPAERLELRAFYDNDFFIHNANGGDRGYTNGIRLQGMMPVPRDDDSISGRPHNPSLDWFLQLCDSEGGEGVPFLGVAVGQEIFTPANLGEADEITWDQPYAGWLYVGAIFELRGETSLLNLEFDVGGTGDLSLAEPVQKFIHEHSTSTIPRGWENQISTGVGANLYVKFSKLLFNIESPSRHGVPVQVIDTQFYSTTAVGTFNSSQAIGSLLRIGYVKQQRRHGIREGEIVPDRQIPSEFKWYGIDMFQAYVFARLQSSLVLWNATIQGLPFRENEQTQSIKPIVLEGETGIVLQPINTFDVLLSVINRTQETRTGREDAAGHSWGQIQLGFHLF